MSIKIEDSKYTFPSLCDAPTLRGVEDAPGERITVAQDLARVQPASAFRQRNICRGVFDADEAFEDAAEILPILRGQDCWHVFENSPSCVQEAKGIAPAEAFETTIDLNVSAYIPDSYISNEALKLDTYKRIAAIENKEEYEDMTEELTDRFGEPPKNVQNLLAVAELKALAHCAYVTELKQMGDSVRVTLQQHAKIDVARIPELLQKYRDELKFQMESLAFVYTPRRRNSKEKIDLLEKSHALVEDLLQITQE